MSANMTYYSVYYNNETMYKLTYDEVMNCDIKLVNCINKINNNLICSDKLSNICLYTSEVEMSPKQYIDNYRSLYGLNVINDNNIKIIEKFNN